MPRSQGTSPTTSNDELRRALRAAQRENRRFRTLIMSQAIEVWAADASGQQSEIVCDDGHSLGEAAATPLQLRLEHVHPDDLPQLHEVIGRAQQKRFTLLHLCARPPS